MRKCVLITGANGCLGQALLGAFASSGYTVIATDLQSSVAENAERNLAERMIYVPMDLSRAVHDRGYADWAVGQFQSALDASGLSVLINNAAVQVVGGVDSLTVEDWRKTLDVNLLAPFKLVQAFLPNLEAAGGCIINISSIHARLTKPNFVAYATSKAALSGMTRAMAVDLGGRVRVNAIEPAAIETAMLRAGFEGQPDQYGELARCHPQGRIGTPEEVAALALSIAQGELRFLHGACIGMDGGISSRLHDPA